MEGKRGGRTHCMVLFQTLRTAQTLSQHQAHPLIFSAGLHSLTACRWSNLPISSTTYLFFVPRLILMALGWRSSYRRFGTPPLLFVSRILIYPSIYIHCVLFRDQQVPGDTFHFQTLTVLPDLASLHFFLFPLISYPQSLS